MIKVKNKLTELARARAKERWNKWRKNNLEREKERVKEWRKNNPELSKNSSKKWRENNPELAKTSARTANIKWRSKNILKIKRKYMMSNRDIKKKKTLW